MTFAHNIAISRAYKKTDLETSLCANTLGRATVAVIGTRAATSIPENTVEINGQGLARFDIAGCICTLPLVIFVLV